MIKFRCIINYSILVDVSVNALFAGPYQPWHVSAIRCASVASLKFNLIGQAVGRLPNTDNKCRKEWTVSGTLFAPVLARDGRTCNHFQGCRLYRNTRSTLEAFQDNCDATSKIAPTPPCNNDGYGILPTDLFWFEQLFNNSCPQWSLQMVLMVGGTWWNNYNTMIRIKWNRVRDAPLDFKRAVAGSPPTEE